MPKWKDLKSRTAFFELRTPRLQCCMLGYYYIIGLNIQASTEGRTISLALKIANFMVHGADEYTKLVHCTVTKTLVSPSSCTASNNALH